MKTDEDDDLVRTWWVWSPTPYVDRVVPEDEIARIRGTYVYPDMREKKWKREHEPAIHCEECGTFFHRGEARATLCSDPCRWRVRQRKAAERCASKT